jgi:hypothetical protein
MINKAAWAVLPGATPAEKLAYLGLVPKATVDVRKLRTIADNYGVPIYLFFEENLARTRTLESVLAEFAQVPEYERPVILVTSFLRFTQENDPSFEQTMEEFPLEVEIVSAGEHRSEPYVSCLMPFLDELDLSAELPEPGLHTVPTDGSGTRSG